MGRPPLAFPARLTSTRRPQTATVVVPIGFAFFQYQNLLLGKNPNFRRPS